MLRLVVVTTKDRLPESARLKAAWAEVERKVGQRVELVLCEPPAVADQTVHGLLCMSKVPGQKSFAVIAREGRAETLPLEEAMPKTDGEQPDRV